MKTVRSLALGCAVIFCVATSAAAADQVIFLVRHAERSETPAQAPSQMMMADNPPLSAAGQARAQRLAAVLRSAGVRHIFTTEFLRTRQTAAPLASQEHVGAVMAAAKDVDALVARLRSVKGPTLVVGHSNTIPDVLKKLGVAQEVRIGEKDYDDLFVVVRPSSAAPTLLRLHY